MANIPVERTGTGTPWWLWLLGLLLLVGVIWLIAELFDNEPDADEIAGTDDNVGVIDDVELGADAEPGPNDAVITPITAEEDLYADTADVVSGGQLEGVTVTRLEPGTPVDLDGAPVFRVIGDSAFWIGQDDARQYLVVLARLGESETGAGGSDGVFNVDEGDTVSIDRAIARYLEGERGLSELTDDDTERLRQRNAYIRVNSRDDVTVSG